MLRINISIILFFLFLNFPAQAKLNIFACEPEWGSLAKEVVGDLAEIKIATTAYQDPHHIRARPSLINAMVKADFVFCTGMDLEVGWLPLLLEKGKKQVQVGRLGNFMAGDFVKAIEVPKEIDRSHGDVHIYGNPHIHLNPYNIIKILDALVIRLGKINPENKEIYLSNAMKFKREFRDNIKLWERKSVSLRGKKIIVNHRNWSYLVDWLGINRVASLEPFPGIPPKISHLKNLLELVSSQNIQFILLTEFESDKHAKWLAEKSDIKILKLPYTVGSEGVNDLNDLFEEIIREITTSSEIE